MGLNGTILILGGWDSSFFFFREHYKRAERAEIKNKQEKNLDNQGKNLLQ